jgi:hypothetical protein
MDCDAKREGVTHKLNRGALAALIRQSFHVLFAVAETSTHTRQVLSAVRETKTQRLQPLLAES